MKNLLLPISLILAFLLFVSSFFLSCNNPSNSEIISEDSSTSFSIDLWADSQDVSSNIELDSSAASSRSLSYLPGTSRAPTTTNKIFFRSSDIEFWSIDSVSDINDIFSAKYQQWDQVAAGLGFADGRSLEYKLGDTTESVVFTPYNNYSHTLGGGLNPDWVTRSTGYKDAGLNKINLARLDIGDGQVTFVIDGEERMVLKAGQQEETCPYTLEDLENAVTAGQIIQDSAEYNYYYNAITTGSGYYGPFGGGIDANSIIFVDKAFLSEPVIIEIDDQEAVVNGGISSSDLGIATTDFELVQTVISNRNGLDPTTMIDCDGALFLPLDPVDLSSFDPNTNTLKIELGWDIAKAIHKANNQYFMDNRVKNTSFNFSVAIKIQ